MFLVWCFVFWFLVGLLLDFWFGLVWFGFWFGLVFGLVWFDLVFGLIWIPVVLLIRAVILDAQWDAGMNSDDFWHKFVFAGGFVAAALGIVMFFWGALEFSRRSGR